MKNVNKPSTSIKNWAADDRPREKLMLKGAAALSNSELLAILLNNGSKNRSALDLAKEILKKGDDNLNELGKLSLADLKQVPGIGMAKSISIAAALELGRRRHASAALEKTVIRSSSNIAQYLRASIKDFSYEVFAVIFLNRANKINHFEIISKGGISGTVADPRIILKKALEEDATAIVLCHNHPSGNLQPSRADEELTKKIKEAASFFDIKILDHIIVSEEGYYSFADDGIL
ncbi:MAG: DNA repair protein RadC [Chitinophagaceae bacterium]|nr:DNA repair protein RadC [Chitinophagaceae bacterium]